MKNWQLVSVLLLSACWLPASAQVDSAATPKPIIYTVVEQPPKFTGGMNKLSNYLRKNLHYPQVAREQRRDGKVFVNFLVTDTGAIEDVKALNSLGPEFDAEAVRVVKDMPPWIPGKQDGKSVYCRYNLPINFSR